MLPRIAEQLGVEGSNKEGWLSGLCDVLLERRHENGIELHVAYPVTQSEKKEGYDFDYNIIELFNSTEYQNKELLRITKLIEEKFA